MLLIQVVPGMPPKVDGIGDYSLELARKLREQHGIESAFMVTDLDWNGGAVEGFPAIHLSQRNSAGFKATVAALQQASGDPEPAHILMHFSPYGYEKRGCPFWLLQVLEQWDREHRDNLHFAFHELENHTPNPLSSTFWLTGPQAWLVKRAAQLGRFKYTTTEPYRYKLERRGSGRVFLIPSFSTLGEVSEYPSWGDRQRQIVVFGRGAQRREAYGRGMAALRQLCDVLDIRTVIDIGEPVQADLSALKGIEVRQCGRLPGAEIVDYMKHSIGSFLSYPVPLLTKSTIFSASAGYGAVPFIHDPWKEEISCTGLLPNMDYVALPVTQDRLQKLSLEQVSRYAFWNYKRRNSTVAAYLVAAQVFGQPF